MDNHKYLPSSRMFLSYYALDESTLLEITTRKMVNGAIKSTATISGTGLSYELPCIYDSAGRVTKKAQEEAHWRALDYKDEALRVLLAAREAVEITKETHHD